ncbi:hypothetical protein K7957_13895 [Sphingomonas yunnanensis]|uniref:glycosyltransferase family 32 protein n=1 Tax=Sphingomonas yunnanensis TaxID=310400 RepID=UPI001CA71DC8|nr:glycosyltransferase [Sphingomonas yunnanensis]MBY9064032.1 hypothetical protein [Sphingomonas yunnanensis]
MRHSEAYWNDALPHLPQQPSIAKKIHQIFLRGALPPRLAENVAEMKALNGDHAHRLYDLAAGEDLIERLYGPEVLRQFQRIDPAYGAARADLLRYLIVYAEGGAYIDVKSYLDRPLRTALRDDDRMILSYWDNEPGGEFPGFGKHAELGPGFGELQQWHVIASAGHPLLRAVLCKVLANIDGYRPWRVGVGRNGVLRTTGPIAYTRAIAPLLARYPHRLLRSPAEIGLHYSIADTYDHRSVFPTHYSTLTTPVVTLPMRARPLAGLYSLAVRLRARHRG